MKWYERYLKVHNLPFTEGFFPICDKMKKCIDLLQPDEPIATVSVIAYKKEKHLLAYLWSLCKMKCELLPVSFAYSYSPRGIISNVKNGILYDNGNIKQLAIGICSLIENETLHTSIGKLQPTI